MEKLKKKASSPTKIIRWLHSLNWSSIHNTIFVRIIHTNNPPLSIVIVPIPPHFTFSIKSKAKKYDKNKKFPNTCSIVYISSGVYHRRFTFTSSFHANYELMLKLSRCPVVVLGTLALYCGSTRAEVDLGSIDIFLLITRIARCRKVGFSAAPRLAVPRATKSRTTKPTLFPADYILATS